MMGIAAIAPAKLNLGLEILGRRDDGYHEIRTILQTVSICDRLRIEPAPALEITCSAPGIRLDKNLAYQAAELVRRRFAVAGGARIELTKAIPTAAGLGGASSDAAACLRALTRLWSLPAHELDLSTMAAQIGSDVPFFLHGGTMLVRGRGEQLTKLAPVEGIWFVVVSPRVSAERKTARMYQSLRETDFTDGATVESLARAIDAGLAMALAGVPNAFARAVHEVFPHVRELHDAFVASGAPFVAMTGAGPSLYTATDDEEAAGAMRGRLGDRLGDRARVFLCQPMAANPPLASV